MLVELVVENYAVVERLRVRFHQGFHALTGETGSGKSIVVDAVSLLLGGRASAEMVRTGASRARISGIFEFPDSPGLRKLMESSGVDAEEGEILIEREIQANGKSRAFAASRPVTIAFLREAAPYLADIHGQNDQQRLYDPENQRKLLDEFAQVLTSKSEVSAIWRQLRACDAELDELAKREQEQLRLSDLWTFQRKEIEAAALKPNEDVTLEADRRVLQNVTRLSENAEAAYTALYDGPASAAAQLRIGVKRLQELVKIDESVQEILDTLNPAIIASEEASRTLRDYVGKLEADPARLEAVETRLAMLEKLKRKYGTSIGEIQQFLADVQKKMAIVETATERREELARRKATLDVEFAIAAAKLSEKRREAARKLEKKIEKELATLAMPSAKFKIQVTQAPPAEHGADAIGFVLSANAGEELRGLEKVASGGEVSRVAQAIQTCLGTPSHGTPHLLIFDEVDAGIGGEAAESVGRRLKGLATSNQVICVTHQAQIAGFADHHYRVEKHEVKGRTVAAMEELTGQERTREIGRMLSGQRLTPEALKHAEQLIRSSAAGS